MHEIVVNFLGSRSSLQVLEVDHNYLWVPLCLHRMYSLREITFTDDINALWKSEKYYCHLPLNPVGVQTYNNLAKLRSHVCEPTRNLPLYHSRSRAFEAQRTSDAKISGRIGHTHNTSSPTSDLPALLIHENLLGYERRLVDSPP